VRRSEHLRVATPPAKPLIIWDGDCHFCRRWIERWRVITHDEVDHVASQEIGDSFPEIARDEFTRSVVYIDRAGEVFVGAEAVYRSLGNRASRRWLSWNYEHIPGFANLSEFAYGMIARHRIGASNFTRVLWGDEVRPPTYYWARKWFLRSLGIIYAIAFVSLWVQIDGLIGASGILPVREFITALREQLGGGGLFLLPTLCWFNSSDSFLHFLCGAGVFFSLVLICDFAPAICLVILFIFYLSLTLAGQTFLSFQWDILLLETGFLAIFFAPWRIWPSRLQDEPISRPALFLLKLLLFKLLLMSGIVKLTSGDSSWGWTDHGLDWSAMTALDYHYWSQPLPTIFAWYADKTPQGLKHFSVATCLFIEIAVPLFIWAPRRLRVIACGLLIFLQVAIAITGNYCFFNLLTIALCLLLIDDGVWRRQRGALQADNGTRAVMPRYFPDRFAIYGAIGIIILTLPLNVWLIYSAFSPESEMPRPIRIAYEQIEPFRIVNGYGLFRVMTKDRGEIEIQGSLEGVNWVAYEFRWKPGDVMRAPRWCAPHQPRLDWQMWFAALGSHRQNPWFVQVLVRLLEGKSPVTELFMRNPFPGAPPRYVRAVFYRYRFADVEEHRRTGAWWTRQEVGEYLPSFSLADLR
jgi:predicted DCC family thiol-disulfide oxidoreductase YuxK